MLHLRIGFPSGRYFGASADDPRSPEWPPHPSRVFSALVAAAYAGGRQPTDPERRALGRLESAPPPALDCPPADLRAAPDAYVPVNDVKTRIDAKKRQSTGVLHPNRQVRQFPAAFLLGEPEVVLTWPIDLDPDDLQVLDGIASRVTHVGTSHSFATASFSTEGGASPRWVPRADGGHYLRIPRAGRLDELDRLATQGYGTLRRPAALAEVLWPYAPVDAVTPAAPRGQFDWVVLRMLDASWGADTAHTLGRALRRAAMSILGDAAPVAVHGHDDAVPHVAWLPLPDVGHVHARGRVRGLGIGLPWAMPESDRTATLAALAKLEVLALPDGQAARVLPSIDGPETPLALRSATWAATSDQWSTVTPALLDRPPKRATPEKLEAALRESLARAGLPDPVEVRLSSVSDFEGAPSTLDIPTRVPRTHARVRFASDIKGPVIAGRWRNFGIGLFRPTPPELRS